MKETHQTWSAIGFENFQIVAHWFLRCQFLKKMEFLILVTRVQINVSWFGKYDEGGGRREGVAAFFIKNDMLD